MEKSSNKALHVINDFNYKSSYIRYGIQTKQLYDWDVVFLIIPIIAVLLSFIFVIRGIDLSYVVISEPLDSFLSFSIYINSMYIILVCLCPPFLICWFLRYLISEFRKKFFHINLNPCIFTRRNIAILCATLLPFIFNFPYGLLDSISDPITKLINFSLSIWIGKFIGIVFSWSDIFTNKFTPIIIFIMMIGLHVLIYFIFTSFYKLFDKHYNGKTYINFIRAISRSSFLTWLIPFIVSTCITCLFFLII